MTFGVRSVARFESGAEQIESQASASYGNAGTIATYAVRPVNDPSLLGVGGARLLWRDATARDGPLALARAVGGV